MSLSICLVCPVCLVSGDGNVFALNGTEIGEEGGMLLSQWKESENLGVDYQ